MKIGLSTYSLAGAFRAGLLDFPSIVTKIAEFGGEHVEVVPLGSDFTVDTEMVDKVLKAAKDANDGCMAGLVKFCREHLSPNLLKGFMMASWEDCVDAGFRRTQNLNGIDQLAAALRE